MKIIGHLTINATNLNHMPMKLKIGRSHLKVTLIIQKRRKPYVIDAVMTGPQAIKVGTIRQYSVESSMERKCKSLHKKSHLIPIPTPNHNEGRNQENTQALRTKLSQGEGNVVNIQLILLLINKQIIKLLVKGRNPSLCLLKTYKYEIYCNFIAIIYQFIPILLFIMKVGFNS